MISNAMFDKWTLIKNMKLRTYALGLEDVSDLV